MERSMSRNFSKALLALSAISLSSFATEPLPVGSDKILNSERILTTEKLTQLYQLNNIAVSPDGKWLVYGKKEGFVSNNNFLYLQNLSTGKVTQLTSHKKAAGNVKFASDSRSIYFLSSRSGSSQVWQLPLTGGEAIQLTDLPVDINGFTVSSDGKHFAFSITAKAGCTNFDCTLDAMKADKAAKHNVRTYDQLMVRHWDVWLTPYNEHLFYAKRPATGLIKDAADLIADWQSDIAGISQVSISPNGNKIAFSAKAPSKDQAWTTNFDIFEVDLASLSISNLTEGNKAWDAKPKYSSNGRYLAYVAMDKPGYESDKFTLMLRDTNSGRTKSVAANWDRSISSYAFAKDNSTVYAIAQDIGQKSIFEIQLEFGDVSKVFGNGTASDLHVNGDNLIFANHDLDSPKDIYSIGKDGFGLKQLTQVNKSKLANIDLGEFEQFNFKGWNDETVYGYWLKPAGFQPGKKYPMAFLVHGGPQGSFGNMFHYRWNAQLWAAQGYAVVMIDFHGSTGYGQAFTDSIARDWGGKPLEDLRKGFVHVSKTLDWVDTSKSCALGASYGGYMMNWIAGNWNTGFNCLVNHAGLFDMPSFYGSTEELWFPEHDLGGEVWQLNSDYQKFNPAAYVKNWQTPMLVIQGELDYRVPYAQSLGAFTALQRQGIDSRLVMFPDEDHHIKKPDNLVFWYQEVFAWMAKHLK
jgi:dipeptidyl aminopeptidase/acylaminoacyl peptidase